MILRPVSMQVRYNCPVDGCIALIEYEPLEECSGTIKCPRCGVDHPLTVTPIMRENGMADVCAVCGCRELFIRKDFPQRLGLIIVIAFGLAAIYAFTFSVIVAWTILAAAVVVDVIIYAIIGRVTTCYACRAEYRKGKLNPAHEGFDLARSEKY